jgi:hypothetical protein
MGRRLVEGQGLDGFQLSRDAFDGMREASGEKVDQKKLCDRKRDDNEEDLPVRPFSALR